MREMIAFAKTFSSPIIRLHSEVTADFHARVVAAVEEEEEQTGEMEEASSRWRRPKAKTSLAPPRQPEAKVAK